MAALGDVEVDGIDYTPNGIQEVVDELIEIRNHSLANLGDDKGAHYAIFFSHVIAYMNDYIEAVKKNVAKKQSYERYPKRLGI
jgi:hypothetical protein